MHTPRSALFVPADRPERHQRALDSGAAAVIVDLEDAIAAAQKVPARQILVDMLPSRSGDTTCLVRINSPLLPEGRADLEALPQMGADGIVVPKADLESVELAAAAGLPLVALVETAAAILDAAAIAAHPAVDVLMLGPVDLSLELGVKETPDGDQLQTARGLLVLGAAAGGIPGPLDGPCVLPHDEGALALEIERARRLGFAGKIDSEQRLAAIQAQEYAGRAIPFGLPGQETGAVLLDERPGMPEGQVKPRRSLRLQPRRIAAPVAGAVSDRHARRAKRGRLAESIVSDRPARYGPTAAPDGHAAQHRRTDRRSLRMHRHHTVPRIAQMGLERFLLLEHTTTTNTTQAIHTAQTHNTEAHQDEQRFQANPSFAMFKLGGTHG